MIFTDDPEERKRWPDPTPEDLTLPAFDAIWNVIKTWDINVPGVYVGYCGATGNHVKAILDTLRREGCIDERSWDE